MFTLEKLKPEECFRILKRALSIRQEAETAAASTSASSIKPEEEEEAAEVKPAAVIDEELLHFLAQAADGDARTALNSLELALAASEGGATIDHQVLKDSLKKAHLLYDRVGDAHYDTISYVALEALSGIYAAGSHCLSLGLYTRASAAQMPMLPCTGWRGCWRVVKTPSM